MVYVLALASAAVILFSSEAFINGVEWLAYRWRLGPAGTGAVLAALGGTLPESLVTLLAATGGSSGVSMGTALGSPALLSTLAFAVVALAARGRLEAWSPGTGRSVRANLRWFAWLFAAAVAIAALPGHGREPVVAPVFVAAWILFCARTWDGGGEGDRPARNLYLSRGPSPTLAAVVLQTLLACAGLAVGSDQLVVVLERLSAAWGLPPLVVTLTLAPLATELPEIATSALWAVRGRVDLALQNISGALVMSATLPVAASLLFNPWRLGTPASLAAGVSFAGTALAGAACGDRLRTRVLAAGGLVFAAYVVLLYG